MGKSKKESRAMMFAIIAFSAMTVVLFSNGVAVEVVSWPKVIFSSVTFGAVMVVVSLWGSKRSVGVLATEDDLDEGIQYLVYQTVRLKNGVAIHRLDPLDAKYKIEAIEEPREGFQRFELLEGRHLVSRKLKARVVDGRLWTPIS